MATTSKSFSTQKSLHMPCTSDLIVHANDTLMSLSNLSDEALLASLNAICSDERHLIARQVLQLVEVENRRLELRTACASMFDFCTRRLGMSEGIAFRRLNAARLARRFPVIIGAIERGEIHLCGLVALKDVLTDDNHAELLAEAIGKSTRQLEAIAEQRKAAMAPRPSLSLLPADTAACQAAPISPGASADDAHASAAPQPAAPCKPANEPRYPVQLSATATLKAKLRRAADLMSHRVPDGDLAIVVERAMDLLLAKLETERLGKSARPQRTQRPAKPGRIAQAVRRAVFERDGEQCTFATESGERCPSRTRLELDHIESRALGGSDDLANLRVRCRAHNRLHAEEVFGAAHVQRRIEERQRVSRRGPAPQATATLAPATRDTPTAAPHAEGHTHARAHADLCIKGLANMGFAEAKAQRAVSLAVERRASRGGTPSFEDLFRDALTALT